MSDLRNVPGIGPKKEKALIALGYDSLEALKEADPNELYVKACLYQNEQLDKCVLYAFRCAVAYANDPSPDPSKYRWWLFCDKDT
ncbi:MAG: TfoX/Sxy family DNA transformation protein [Clostridia bacterium]|nr:TfoX/Sxy family DNA transformation protein [Clostridia bacterium]